MYTAAVSHAKRLIYTAAEHPVKSRYSHASRFSCKTFYIHGSRFVYQNQRSQDMFSREQDGIQFIFISKGCNISFLWSFVSVIAKYFYEVDVVLCEQVHDTETDCSWPI